MLLLSFLDEMHVLLFSDVRAVDYDDLGSLFELSTKVFEVLVLISCQLVYHGRGANALHFVYINFGVARSRTAVSGALKMGSWCV